MLLLLFIILIVVNASLIVLLLHTLQALEAPKGLPKFRRREADGRPALPSNLQLEDDAYSELYPEYFGGLAETLDSDEEGKAAKEEEDGADKKKVQVRREVVYHRVGGFERQG